MFFPGYMFGGLVERSPGEYTASSGGLFTGGGGENLAKCRKKTDAGNTSGQAARVVVLLPNTVVIMNESFSDLRVLGEFETT